uniref:Non-structural protein n=1 Tax=Porcine hemagglutinating encephalomyelitis virus TaxID=42005 RepID=Q2QKN2_9BETC|nr:non-structural protein [Porcine hemagglutinating encephalomyelitis virus]WHM28108.1 nonstructural protein [Porcine hemagglutinating encephalomyelitis virus]
MTTKFVFDLLTLDDIVTLSICQSF